MKQMVWKRIIHLRWCMPFIKSCTVVSYTSAWQENVIRVLIVPMRCDIRSA